jgi:hypothetical protein
MATLNKTPMTTYNLTDEITLDKAVALPKEIRPLVQSAARRQAIQPRAKAKLIATLLTSANINPNANTRLYVGKGDTAISGYTIFQTALRKLGYQVVTRI